MNVRRLSAILLVVLLSSCGWHLQGNESQQKFDSFELVLTAQDIYSPLYRTFKRTYENRRVAIVSSGAPHLRLLQEKVTARTVSLNTELDPAEETMMLVVSYEVTIGKQPAQTFNTQTHKTLVLNKNRAAARDSERARLLEEMRTEIAERILNQLITASEAQ